MKALMNILKALLGEVRKGGINELPTSHDRTRLRPVPPFKDAKTGWL